jgi:GT2 family glycosyltransferase
MTGGKSVCCLIITYAPTDETLGECLDGLLNQTHKPSRILIADNLSSGSHIVESLNMPGVDKLMLPKNYGFSGAINRALDKIDEDFVLVMNFDIVLDSKFIEEALKGFTDDNILCVTGKTLFMADKVAIDNTGTLVNGLMSAYNRGVGQIDIGQYDAPDQPMGACFAAALIRRTAFERDFIGRMDDSYFLYYEDVDWCYRLNIYGYRAAYIPTAVAHHHHSLTTRGKGVMFKYYYIQRNLLYTIVKNMRSRTVTKLLAMHFIYHTRRARIEKQFRWVTAKIYLGLLVSLPRLWIQRIPIQRKRVVSDTDVINIAIGERAHLDDIMLTPRVTWDNLADTYSRLARITGSDFVQGQAYILAAAAETDEIKQDMAEEIRKLFESEDERIRDMLGKLLDRKKEAVE